MKAIILKADGTPPFVKDIERGVSSLNVEVGGYIEGVASTEFGDELSIFANEEGIMHQLPINRNMLAIRQLHLVSPVYLGNLVVLGRDDAETTDVPQKFIDLLVAPTGE